MGSKTTQRVVLTRWGLEGRSRGMDGQGDPPTSRCDSLVVVWAGDERGRGKKAHQRVVKTRWWLFPVSPPPALPPPASCYDSLVVRSPQPPSSRPRLSLPLHNHHQRVVMTRRWFALSSPRPFSPGPPSSPTSYTPWWVSLPSSLSPALLVFW